MVVLGLGLAVWIAWTHWMAAVKMPAATMDEAGLHAVDRKIARAVTLVTAAIQVAIVLLLIAAL